MGASGKVDIRAQREGGRVLITVEDDGDGMPPEVLRRVFEPFFTTKPFGTGTGLGLAVSRGLIAGLGGDLRLESELGRGTRAVVELPEAGAAARERSRPPPGAEPIPRAGPLCGDLEACRAPRLPPGTPPPHAPGARARGAP